MKLIEFINLHFDGNRAAFGRANGVTRQKVNDWLNRGYIVVDGWLYSPRKRELKTD